MSNNLQEIYANAKVCETNSSKCLSLEPDLQEIIKNSRDYDRLLWAWKGWHEMSGSKMRQTFAEVVKIKNKNAKENNYKDLSDNWLEEFEDDKFEPKYDQLFSQLSPLYEQLHAYVRRKLSKTYGSKYSPDHNSKHIPAHLLGINELHKRIT